MAAVAAVAGVISSISISTSTSISISISASSRLSVRRLVGWRAGRGRGGGGRAGQLLLEEERTSKDPRVSERGI